MEFHLVSAALRASIDDALAMVDSVNLDWIETPQVRAAVEVMVEARTNDQIAVIASLRSRPEFAGESVADWMDWVLDTHVGTVASGGVYLKAIKAAYNTRQRIKLADRISRDAEDPHACARHLAELAELVSEEVTARPITDGYLELLDERMAKPDGEIIPSHSQNLDRVAPIRKSHITVVAAATGGGKTTFALNCATAAAQAGHGVLIVSMEMRRQELCDRVVANVGQVDAERILKFDRATDEDRHRVRSTVSRVAGLPIDVVDAFAVTEGAIAAQCRRAMRQRPFSLLVVDYVQLMKSDRKSATRTEEVSACTRAMKLLANELNVAVLLISQFNRSASQADRPHVSQLKESGSIEQDASVVLLLHHAGGDDCEAIIAKNRAGRTGAVDMKFDKKRFTFRCSSVAEHYSEFDAFQ